MITVNTLHLRRSSLALILVLAATGCTSSSLRNDSSAVERSEVTRGGKYVGATEREVLETDTGRRVITRQIFPVKVDGTKRRTVVVEKTRLETFAGKTNQITLVSTVGNSITTTTAAIGESSATVTRTTKGDTRQQHVALPENTYFDNGAELFASWDFDEHPEMVFHALDIRAPLVEKIVYTLEKNAAGQTLQKLSYAEDRLRSVVTRRYDRQGTLISSEQPMFGHDLRSSSAESTAANNYSLVDPVRSSSMKSPYRISRDARSGHMRYTFGFKAGPSFVPPETAEQRVEVVNDKLVLDVCTQCGPGLDRSDSYLRAALEPTFWLESDHPELTRIAAKLADQDLSDEEKMSRLEHWARLQMTDIDFAGHFSAAEALSLRRGDCTEGAVVLAALGRAAGIPTKVASGIVYSREQYHGTSHSFAPHAWTMAYVDGRWASFDMSLEGFDSTYIAFNLSDGDPGSIVAGHTLAALLTWDAMTQVKKRGGDN